MKCFFIKFNHGVEIGAYMAYVGHHQVTQDPNIAQICKDELEHRQQLKDILSYYNQKPSKIIDGVFFGIGWTIQRLCHYSPKFMLDRVARLLEMFAVFNYKRLAERYPTFWTEFTIMGWTEDRHAEYFKTGKWKVIK